MDNRKPANVRSFMEYLPKAMKFYSLKNEQLARIVFILVLAANLIGQLYVYRLVDAQLLLTYPVNEAQLQESLRNLGTLTLLSLVRDIAIYVVSAFYLLAFITELRGEPAGLGKLPGQVIRRMFPYLFASMAVTVARNLGLLLFVVPGIIIHILFLFNTSLIIDGKSGFFRSFKLSKDLTEGYRRQIFSIIAFVFIFFTTMNMFFGSMGSLMVGMAISAFITTVGHLVSLRVVALLYNDLYEKKCSQVQETTMV